MTEGRQQHLPFSRLSFYSRSIKAVKLTHDVNLTASAWCVILPHNMLTPCFK